jgi:hypothetical protein
MREHLLTVETYLGERTPRSRAAAAPARG